MAETPDSPKVESLVASKRSQEFWALIVLGATVLVCFTLMAIGLAMVLTRSGGGSSINNAPVINVAPAVAPVVVQPTPGIQRPYDSAKSKNERASAMDRTQPALPGVLATPTPNGGQRKLAFTRADPPSPPSPALQPTVDPKRVNYRERADPDMIYKGQKPLPMPVRYSPDSKVKALEAFAAPDPAVPDPQRFSYAPDVAFAESGIRGQSLDLQLSSPRKTSTVNGLRAPKGFQFFTAKLRILNQGAQPVVLRVDDLEIHDAEGVGYLANPELVMGALPEPSLTAGAEAQVELSFLVSDSVPLKELAVQEAPGQMALVPLQAR